MSIIDTIEAAYDARPMDRVRVPEWEVKDGPEMMIYYKPATQHELDVINKAVPDGATGSRWNTQLVILKSLDESGRRLFSDKDITRLTQKGYSAVISRLARVMVAVPSMEDAEKN
jgi:hypothetical protein